MPHRINPYRGEGDMISKEELYQYPQQLRDSLEHVPAAPGIYFFWAEKQTLPLYIGKSVNIRSRVLAHLRTVKEAQLLKQTHHITWIATAGDIGAQLLEARTIKQMFPLHNKRLRKQQSLCSLCWQQGRLTMVFSGDQDFSQAQNLYGLFRNKRSAETFLRKIADEEQLCLTLLGLERVTSQRPCFRFMLGKCRGACQGREPEEEHQQRLSARLAERKVIAWPYRGRVAIHESFGELCDYHVIDRWSYLGTVSSLEQAATLTLVEHHFDVDSYKILCKALFNDQNKIIELE